jgi:hypothetical protein
VGPGGPVRSGIAGLTAPRDRDINRRLGRNSNIES